MTITYSRFPARVRTSDGTDTNRCAVVVVDGRAELAVQRPGGDVFEPAGIQVIATLDGVTLGPAGREVVLTAADGQTWTVSEGDGCGCRSPLSQWYASRIQGQAIGT